MAYVKTWADNEVLNKNEVAKLEKDGLEILNDIPYYAENGFESIPKEQWDLFKWAGLYLQKPKEAGYFMMRVNVPSGLLNNEQLKVLAGISRDYGRGVFDITTRQAVQYHWLTIDQIPDIYKRLESVGLSSVGACGDITRTIMGNPLAGIDPNETIDTREIVQDVYDFFQRNEEFSNLPRKYKMSISSNVYNAAHAEINCLAFIPAEKEIDGEVVQGFNIKVGGGLSSKPYLGQEVDVFIRPEQVKDTAIAVTTIFRDFGYRDKRHRARLKFLIADWGVEKFKEELVKLTGPLPEKGQNLLKEWNAGYFYGVHKQKQEGLSYVGFNVPVGRLDAEEVFELADIAAKYGNGEVRTCNSQNIVIPNVPHEKVEELLKEKLFERITTEPRNFIGYAVSCTGIEYCNLALVETKERMRRIAEYLDEEIAVDVPVRMHMIGCPNSCGQRQIADIGLQGVVMKTKDKGVVEAFEIYIGGTLNDGGKFNEKLKGKVEAEALGPVLKELISYFKEEKQKGESFYDFVARVGTKALQTELDGILGNIDAIAAKAERVEDEPAKQEIAATKEDDLATAKAKAAAAAKAKAKAAAAARAQAVEKEKSSEKESSSQGQVFDSKKEIETLVSLLEKEVGNLSPEAESKLLEIAESNGLVLTSIAASKVIDSIAKDASLYFVNKIVELIKKDERL